jgi:hypothetical protein
MVHRAFVLASLVLSALPAQDPTISWRSDLAEAQKLAAAERAPLFVVFRCEA